MGSRGQSGRDRDAGDIVKEYSLESIGENKKKILSFFRELDGTDERDIEKRFEEKAADLAEAEGCRIKIWDAYRPISVQQALHDSAPAELAAYVPAPGPYSMHARGITVDVTLCDMEGNELDMPTPFDDFSEHAHSDYAGATETQKANRELLNRIMSGAGFTRSRLEWWHFDGPNRDHYPILDISFAEWEAQRAEQ